MIDQTLVSRTQHRQALNMIQNKGKHSPLDLAWAFWMCSNFSFSNKIGGGIKYSNEFGSPVPRIMRNKKRAFTEKLVKRIENAQIECTDYIKILQSRNVKKAFHYIDPPYWGADQGHYKGWTEENLKELLDFLPQLNGKFLLSNYNSPILDEYIAVHGWQKKEIKIRLKAPRKKVNEKTEVLVWNYDTKGPDLFNNEY